MLSLLIAMVVVLVVVYFLFPNCLQTFLKRGHFTRPPSTCLDIEYLIDFVWVDVLGGNSDLCSGSSSSTHLIGGYLNR